MKYELAKENKLIEKIPIIPVYPILRFISLFINNFLNNNPCPIIENKKNKR
tara:strand:+ start:100 stop:252 length:153 start_codon:yes stop_codon:yes gene_type:complete